MTSVTLAPTPPATATGFRHEALLWRDEADFLAAALPFVVGGLEERQPVLVAVTPTRLGWLRSALGPDAELVQFVDMTVAGANPARIIPMWQAFLQRADGEPVRGIGEPIWAGRRPVELSECQLHEALLNHAVAADTPLWLLCPYDTGSLDQAVLDEVYRSHPASDMSRLEPAHLDRAGELFAAQLPPGPHTVLVRHVVTVTALSAMRAAVETAASGEGLPAERVYGLVLAAHEVATNSLTHGEGEPVLTLWATPESVVCEVRDQGRIIDPLIGRVAPAVDAGSGRGVWMANQLCDLVQVRSGETGTVTRLHMWR
ncbi:MAG TPA: sensor histidine kinase [Dermatophilaceae bacterium]|nr:sensor histidine kinase [Dermatophilaceae bacterium]